MSGAPTAALGTTVIGGRPFPWGERTYVMGIVNATPDSFSGDGLVRAGRSGATADAVELAARMAAEGADLLDIGGESTRPGHAEVDEAEELRRVVPVVAAVHAAQPGLPISVDTTKPAVAVAALDAGAALINHIWGVAQDDALARLAAERQVPIVLMHNRVDPSYRDLMTDIVADLERAIERALRIGCSWESLIVDPGFGFGKTAGHNLV
ncbi:MAG: dihydropteroate synthase, partial [Chloroflexota bacterium]|nr:dihydropteroate synthase [Chloroflexota bacterium]